MVVRIASKRAGAEEKTNLDSNASSSSSSSVFEEEVVADICGFHNLMQIVMLKLTIVSVTDFSIRVVINRF